MRVMAGIVRRGDGHVAGLVAGVGPVAGGRRVELVVLFLGGQARHERHAARGIGRGQAGRARGRRRGRALGRALAGGGAGGGRALALVRLAVAEALGERVAGDLELRDAVVLVGRHRGEARLREGEALEVLGARVWGGARWRRSHHHVAARLVPVHRVQNYLQ